MEIDPMLFLALHWQRHDVFFFLLSCSALDIEVTVIS